jgi:hypothetical protein
MNVHDISTDYQPDHVNSMKNEKRQKIRFIANTRDGLKQI